MTIGFPILSVLIFLPIAGAVPVLFFRRDDTLLIRTWTLLVALTELLIGLALILVFRPLESGPQLVERADWVPTFGIQYFLGIDGISLAMVLLTVVLGVIATLAAWPQLGGARSKEFAGFLLLLEGGVIGA